MCCWSATLFHCRTATVRDGCSERVGHYLSCPPEETMQEYPAAFFAALKALHTPTTALGSKRSIEPDRTLKVCCVQSDACGRRVMRLDGDTRESARPCAEEAYGRHARSSATARVGYAGAALPATAAPTPSPRTLGAPACLNAPHSPFHTSRPHGRPCTEASGAPARAPPTASRTSSWTPTRWPTARSRRQTPSRHRNCQRPSSATRTWCCPTRCPTRTPRDSPIGSSIMWCRRCSRPSSRHRYNTSRPATVPPPPQHFPLHHHHAKDDSPHVSASKGAALSEQKTLASLACYPVSPNVCAPTPHRFVIVTLPLHRISAHHPPPHLPRPIAQVVCKHAGLDASRAFPEPRRLLRLMNASAADERRAMFEAGDIPTPHLGTWRSVGRPEPPPAETVRLCYQNCYQVLKKGMLDVHHGPCYLPNYNSATRT